MKCTPMRLLNRSEYSKSKWKYTKTYHRNIDPVFITKEYHGYSFTFLRSQIPNTDETPVVSVQNLQLPDDFNTYNTGYSLERWSKKIPRLKSGTKSASARSSTVIEADDITLDVHRILDRLEHDENHDELNEEDVYEGQYDIEELLRKSQERKQEEEGEREMVNDTTINNKKRIGEEKRKKRRLKKTIRFSFSKPASPNTEQIIRVDVTSNVSVEELRNAVQDKNDLMTDDCNRRYRKMTNEGRESGKELDGGFGENGAIKFDDDAEDFVIRCSQLALSHRRR